MERTVVMIRDDQRTKLAKLAHREHVSTAEVHRRAIDAYDPDLTNDNDALEQLADAVIQSNKAAMCALKDAHKALEKTLTHFAKKRNP